jgi:hypothetical protein
VSHQCPASSNILMIGNWVYCCHSKEHTNLPVLEASRRGRQAWLTFSQGFWFWTGVSMAELLEVHDRWFTIGCHRMRCVLRASWNVNSYLTLFTGSWWCACK